MTARRPMWVLDISYGPFIRSWTSPKNFDIRSKVMVVYKCVLNGKVMVFACNFMSAFPYIDKWVKNIVLTLYVNYYSS